MPKCFVYLAPMKGGDRFKIGFSGSPTDRFASLPESIDFDCTWVLGFDTTERARQVESFLHERYGAHRVTPPHVLGGHSEWFSMVCWDAVYGFLEGAGLSPYGLQKLVRKSKYRVVQVRMPVELRERIRGIIPAGYTEHATLLALIELGLQGAAADPSVLLGILQEQPTRGSGRRLGELSAREGAPEDDWAEFLKDLDLG